jgi:myo-inositol-1(or 4)-monophosphatase
LTTAFDLSALAPRIEAIVRTAGLMALEHFRPGAPTGATVTHKPGGSPVTSADLEIDAYLREHLSKLAPELGWLSEETADSAARLEREALFVVDPIDGTRGFADGDPCFAVCVAIVRRGRPVYGLVHAPALNETFFAVAGQGAFRNGRAIRVSRRAGLAGAKLAAPDSLAADLRRSGLHFVSQPRLPSLAMRLLRVADGALDGALARKHAYDWDIAAADLILCEAGGALTDFAGRTPVYNRPEPRHPALAAGGVGLQAELVRAAREAAPNRSH